MKQMMLDEFSLLVKVMPLRGQLKRDIRFNNSTAELSAEQWQQTELLGIFDRSGNNGLLLIQPDDDLYMIAFELAPCRPDASGRVQSVICDFCKTWQSGDRAGVITLKSDHRSNNSVSFLCCGDLKCSQHVRLATKASLISRAQIRETITVEGRIKRLRDRLEMLITDLKLEPQIIE